MGRIDVQTLVLAFERRIAALEKNPPELVSTAVIINMLEKSIDDIIAEHFQFLIRKDMKVLIEKEFNKMRTSYVKGAVKDILNDAKFKLSLEDKVKKCLLSGMKDAGTY